MPITTKRNTGYPEISRKGTGLSPCLVQQVTEFILFQSIYMYMMFSLVNPS